MNNIHDMHCLCRFFDVEDVVQALLHNDEEALAEMRRVDLELKDRLVLIEQTMLSGDEAEITSLVSTFTAPTKEDLEME